MEAPKQQVFKLTNPKKVRHKSEDEQILEMCALVALHYPQYTIEQLYNEVPFKTVQFLYDTIQKWRAETLLLTNMIINGPNSKDKNHSQYKKVITQLGKLVDK